MIIVRRILKFRTLGSLRVVPVRGDLIAETTPFLFRHGLSQPDVREANLLSGRLKRLRHAMGTINVLLAGMAKACGEILLTGGWSFSAAADVVPLNGYR